MPVLTLEVPEESWNQVAMSSIMYGLDMWPDYHGNTGKPTIVELCGSWLKLQQALDRAAKHSLLTIIEVNGAVPIQDGG